VTLIMDKEVYKLARRSALWARSRFKNQDVDDLENEALMVSVEYLSRYPDANPFTLRKTVYGHLRKYCVENRLIRVPNSTIHDHDFSLMVYCRSLNHSGDDNNSTDSAEPSVEDVNVFGVSDIIKMYKISEVELAILNLRIAGYSFDEIAQKLGMGASTAKWHITNVKERAGGQ